MSSHSAYRRVVLCFAVVALFATSPSPAYSAPSAGGVPAERALVAETLERVRTSEQRAAEARVRLAEASRELDAIVAEQDQTRGQLRTRVTSMYRTGELTFVYVLFGARSFQEFASRWTLLTRMNRRDAQALKRLGVLRAKAKQTTGRLLRLQEDSAKAADVARRDLADARKKLAEDEAALAALRRRPKPKIRVSPEHRGMATRQALPQLSGTGPWRTAVASHYGRDFTGRGASGSPIGPYSMMCAHKTLPFGTLVEFEWRGARAVASVQDRGPHTPGRDFDLGPGVVRLLGFEGVQQVRYRVIDR